MPRLIDHRRRERDIGDAALRVLTIDGLAALSVRRVAEEAGIATASLRRAFPTQDALRRFCLNRIRGDVNARIQALHGEGAELALSLLCELLPLDEIRRTELIVQLQFGSLALTDPSVSENVRDLHRDVRAVCAAALEEIDRVALLRPGTDLDIETERLHGLLDGLAMHALSQAAEASDRVVAVLKHHLKAITTTDDRRP
ncbi:TetR/AcrR family transcriptional regulator [Microbacterium halotolerans]|uniref:TetR/AcrR family transcriptional regulator n=1 Tax=Microbacterium halotolerans TaxID=246613 RepID=UPI000E6AC145|nr:TetR/AcrR family transcriptional regulator [Microbacterium halotolerans]